MRKPTFQGKAIEFRNFHLIYAYEKGTAASGSAARQCKLPYRNGWKLNGKERKGIDKTIERNHNTHTERRELEEATNRETKRRDGGSNETDKNRTEECGIRDEDWHIQDVQRTSDKRSEGKGGENVDKLFANWQNVNCLSGEANLLLLLLDLFFFVFFFPLSPLPSNLFSFGSRNAIVFWMSEVCCCYSMCLLPPLPSFLSSILLIFSLFFTFSRCFCLSSFNFAAQCWKTTTKVAYYGAQIIDFFFEFFTKIWGRSDKR